MTSCSPSHSTNKVQTMYPSTGKHTSLQNKTISMKLQLQNSVKYSKVEKPSAGIGRTWNGNMVTVDTWNGNMVTVDTWNGNMLMVGTWNGNMVMVGTWNGNMVTVDTGASTGIFPGRSKTHKM